MYQRTLINYSTLLYCIVNNGSHMPNFTNKSELSQYDELTALLTNCTSYAKQSYKTNVITGYRRDFPHHKSKKISFLTDP